MENDTIIEKLRLITTGLMFQSESDYPVEPFLWDGREIRSISQEDILKIGNYPPETPVSSVEFDRFFRIPTKEQSWHEEEEKKSVKKFQQLVRILEENLSDIKVFKVGEVEVDVYVVGKANSGDFLGIRTKVVQT